MSLSLPPLSLYVHLPWCVKKCPYCDFNSHRAPGEIPEAEYLDALVADLEADLPMVWGRTVHAVFIGGGTPSLFSATGLERLISDIAQRLSLAPGAEITMEANPGTVEHDRFADYRAAGINRISLGVQSFDDTALARLGRIHGSRESRLAIKEIRRAGFDNFNLDLMYALPGQDATEARADVRQALEFDPPHLSHYQLTLEPGTVFARHPPELPGEDRAWSMQSGCAELLYEAGMEHYEISAWARPGHRCLHNLNYWRFGDYLGIGAGAHGKLTLPAEERVVRTVKQRQPRLYLNAARGGVGFRSLFQAIPGADLVFEFFLNRMRLAEPVDLEMFRAHTGLEENMLAEPLERAQALGLIQREVDVIRRTDHGERFLNDLQALFLP